MKLASHKYSDIVNYNELRKYCESKSIVHQDQEASYVVFIPLINILKDSMLFGALKSC